MANVGNDYKLSGGGEDTSELSEGEKYFISRDPYTTPLRLGPYLVAVSIFLIGMLVWDMWGKWREPNAGWLVVKSLLTSLVYWFFLAGIDYFFFKVGSSKPKKRRDD